MAHFAEIDINGVVKRILVVSNDLEHRGADFLANDLGLGGNWVQTSYNNNFRKQFAAEGYIYDSKNDVFIAPKPFESWILDANFEWQAPVSKPVGNEWVWEETILNWIETPQIFTSWSGLENPVEPSIFMDTVSRSAGRYFNALLNAAYPTTYIKWGYTMPHNPESFIKTIGKFSLIVSTIRNPKDSIASSLLVFGATDDDSILKTIENTTQMLKAIKNNQDEITIFTFEQVTENAQEVLETINNKLQIKAINIDEKIIKDELAKTNQNDFYSTPVNNSDELNKLKDILDKPQFVSLMAESKSIYDEIKGKL